MTTHTYSRMSLLAVGAALAALPSAFAQLPEREGKKLSEDPKFMADASTNIDKFIAQEFRRKQIQATGQATDAQFLRRAYLTITGRIPSVEEAKSFLGSEDAGKREKLIDDLLDSEGYVHHTYNWLADLLRAKSEFEDGTGVPYMAWIRDSIVQNKPWDDFVFELVTASGSAWEEDNGAVGYYLRDKGMALDNMANTTRIFLGTRIECAQCHDHPFDNWKQMEFYEMAAFTHGLKIGDYSPATRELWDMERDQNNPRDIRDVAQFLRENIFDFSVEGGGSGAIHLPDDYKYRNGKPGEEVGAKALFGKSTRVSTRTKNKGDAREKFGEWMVSKENPTFTHVIANRLWARVMGIGVFEPLDQLGEGTTMANPELMDYLVRLMKELDYDTKAFQRVLYKAKTFQLAPTPQQYSRASYAFEGRALDRMSAEQVWDSLLVMTAPDVDQRYGNNFDYRLTYRGKTLPKSPYEIYRETRSLSGKELWEYAKEMSKNMGKGNPEMGMSMMRKGTRTGGEMLRASELSSPMPPSHFLRKFGQSSRDVIEGGSKESDVTQVLSLINGHVERHITNGGSEIMKAIGNAGTPEEKIKTAFIGVLSRYPSDDEMAMMLEEVKSGSSDAYKNIVAALISTNEFMFIQ